MTDSFICECRDDVIDGCLSIEQEFLMYNYVQRNCYRQIKNINAILKKENMHWNIENTVMITIKYLEINQILASSNP